MITALKTKDIFSLESLYDSTAITSLRALIAILLVGEKTGNSCWIQGNSNQALRFVDYCLEYIKGKCSADQDVYGNIRYILSLVPCLKFRTEYNMMTIGEGVERVAEPSTKISSIVEVMTDFNRASARAEIGRTTQMYRRAGLLARYLIEYGDEKGFWASTDDINLQDKLNSMIRGMSESYSSILPNINRLFA